MRFKTILIACLMLAGPTVSAGQSTDSTSSSLPPFFTWRDGVMAVAFVGGTVALWPVDKELAKVFRNDRIQANKIAAKVAWGVEWFGKPLPVFIGGGLYLVGHFGKMQRVEELGLHGSEALIMAGTITTTIKMFAGRARPRKNPDNPSDYRFARGWGDEEYRSFPSGHTTGAFAAAAAVTAEANHWWPGSRWYVGPVMFAGASMVGMSRMYHNGHWASDVMAGAAIGTFSGLKVVRYNLRHPENRVNRWFLRMTIVPGSASPLRIGLEPRLVDGPAIRK